MIQLFLKAKHWQLFTLMVGLPMLLHIAMMVSMFVSIDLEAIPNPLQMFNMMKFFPVIMIFYMAIFFGWFWSIAIGLQPKIPEGVQMKTKKFKILFFIPLVYILFFCFLITGVFSSLSEISLESSNTPQLGIIPELVKMSFLIIPFHLLSMFGIFYCQYFVAKTFKTVELQREVRFDDFIGEFFLFWFYFVGIWFLQPKINKLAEGEINPKHP